MPATWTVCPSLSAETVAELKHQTVLMARALHVVGLMNVQFAIKDGVIYVLEVNPRASRTVPFVAKATDSAIASIAARLMAGEPMANFPHRAPYPEGVGPETPLPFADPMTLADPNTPWFSVKEAVLPFARFPGVDTLLGPEMRSTGEVMGLDANFGTAFAKSQIGGGTGVPVGGTVFVSVRDQDKEGVLDAVKRLAANGFRIIATSGTQRYLEEHGVTCAKINKVSEGRPHIVDVIKNGEVQLVINTTDGMQAMSDSRSMRRAALLQKVPYYTTLAGAVAASKGIEAYKSGGLEVRPLQSYFA